MSALLEVARDLAPDLPGNRLLPEQQEALHRRFPHFDPARTASVFHAEQPEHGRYTYVQKGGTKTRHPAIMMANGVVWFHEKGDRPVSDDGRLLKSKAPKKTAPLLTDDAFPARDQVWLVEGQGDAMALLSAGLTGVAVAGGTKTLTKSLLGRFEGKRVAILFDADNPGRQAAVQIAQALLGTNGESIAAEVRNVVLPDGLDPEDFVAGHSDRAAAAAALIALYEASPAITEAAAAEGKPVPVLSLRVKIPDAPAAQPIRLVMTYETATAAKRLAVLAPPGYGEPDGVLGDDEPAEPIKRGESVRHDTAERDPGGPRHWVVCDSWQFEGVVYAPDDSEQIDQQLRDRVLVLPPPPAAGPDTGEALWIDLRAFYKRWFMMPDERLYDVITGYAHMTWRLEDAGWDWCGLLRIAGPSGRGKGGLLRLMQETVYRGFSTRPTKDNLHWVVDRYRDATLLLDEFHPDRGEKDFIDILNRCSDRRNASVMRVIKNRAGQMEPAHFGTFGPKILTSYIADEHEGLARRSFVVKLEEVSAEDLPERMKFASVPIELYAEAEALRGRLLAWQGRMATRTPDVDREREIERLVYEAAGSEMKDVFFPLAVLVPRGQEAALQNLLTYARERRRLFGDRSKRTSVNFYVEKLLASFDDGVAIRVSPGTYGAEWGVPVDTLVLRPGDRAEEMLVAELLGGEGMKKARPRQTERGSTVRVRVWLLDDKFAVLCRRYGHEWPRQPDPPTSTI